VTYDRNYSYVGIRGFNRPGDYNTRVLLLIDGHRINDNIYEQAIIGTEFPLDVDLIDRVEIIRGPGSSLYGSNAFFGVINVITRNGRDVKGTELSAEAASFETYKSRASYGTRFKNGMEMLLSGTVYDSEGPRHLYYPEFDPATNNGIADHVDDDNYHSFFAKTSLNDLTLTGVYSKREKGIPTGSFGTVFNDPRNRTFDEHSYLDLKYEHRFGNDLIVSARAYYDWFYYYGDYVYDLAPLNVDFDSGDGVWWGGEVQATKKVFGSHRVTVGADYRNNIRQRLYSHFVDPYLLNIDDTRRSQVNALYVQDEFQVSDRVIINGGVRYDHYTTFGGTTNPRLAVIYHPAEKSTLKFLYGQAFRAPNNYELYYDDGFAAKANPDLEPETIKTYELVYEQYLGAHLRSSVTGFYYRINDLITTVDVSGFAQFQNIAAAEAQGAELELEGRWENGLQGRLSYTFQKAEDEPTEAILTNAPLHLAKLNLITPVWNRKTFAGAEIQYMGRRKTLDGNYANAFAVANLTMFNHAVVKGLDLSASVYNVFDRRYGDPGAGTPQHDQDVIEQDGRTYRVKLTYAF
jgi:iron complex outermembrane receptor protein